ncbi:MAG: Kdo hydroxylase family protein [Pyrinomonadaceae bacterium]
MSLVKVNDFQYPAGWQKSVSDGEARAKWYCEQLEEGKVLFFDDVPFNLPEEHRKFLLAQHQGDSRYHKNISYRPNQDVLRGFASKSAETVTYMQKIMREYSRNVTQFLAQFLAPYAVHWSLDFASFRPLEEEGRNLPLHKRNDLLHVDAFPTRPTHGGRILRVFTNINPNQSRVWHTTGHFDEIAGRYAQDAGLNQFAAHGASPARGVFRQAMRSMRAVGIPVVDRSVYDKFMLRFHDYLKENADFQNECPKTRLEFPPHSTWIVYTDSVPHAALSGQYALEQTYIISIDGMVAPQKAPIRVLETLAGQTLTT